MGTSEPRWMVVSAGDLEVRLRANGIERVLLEMQSSRPAPPGPLRGGEDAAEQPEAVFA